MIPVTKPFIPPQEEYLALVKSALDRNWLTNNGPLLNELELQLKEKLGLNHGIVVGNGTIALQIAIKALGMKGRVLTTPFTYIATASSIAWEGCEPVFVDLEKDSFNVTADAIKEKIAPDICGIVLTHCFGMPLDVEAIDQIASDAGIPVIYDAAHAFGVTVKGKSIFEYGTISTCSFHATKVFHMIEGGGIFTKDPEVLKRCSWMRNFGHDGPESFLGVGINGKNSEVHAAMGLVNLKYIDDVLAKRKQQCQYYEELLGHDNSLQLPDVTMPGWNYSYYPVLFDSETTCLAVMRQLNLHEIQPRRYFYPSLDSIGLWSDTAPTANVTASRVLCLPLYDTLSRSEQILISRHILRVVRNR
jgi:dTDP-4-amino-4,6-dideoxygalactose transaminase